MKSKCHNAEMRVEGDTTKYYICTECGKACDQMPDFGFEPRVNTIEDRFVFEKPDKSYQYEVLLRVNSDNTRSIATPQDIAEMIDDVAERVENWKYKQYQKAKKQGATEYRQFILNILDGVDIADGECTTKAIRHAISSRVI